MFGMEEKDKKGKNGFLFDVEKELQNKDNQKKYADNIQKRITHIKELLRTGSDKEAFNHLGVLLNGYHALAVVLGRASS